MAVTPTGLESASASARYNISPTPDELRASARAANRGVLHVLPVGVASESGLQVKTIWAARAISSTFPEIHNIGGVRPDYMRWHPNGLALDVMIRNYGSAEGQQLGDRIVAFAPGERGSIRGGRHDLEANLLPP